MSINSVKTVKCPVCGHVQEITVWNSITADDSPDLAEELLKGKINMFECASCSHRALMPTPMLYEDKAKKLLISFTPSNDARETELNYEELQKNTKESVDPDTFAGYSLRYIHDYNDLLEKLLIFKAGLFDKTVEILKLMVLNSEPEKALQRRCIFGKANADELEFMVLDNTEGQVYTSKVPRPSYDSIHKELLSSGVKPYSFGWERVDAEYAAALINGINNC